MSQIVASIVLCASYVLIILTIVITCAGICNLAGGILAR